MRLIQARNLAGLVQLGRELRLRAQNRAWGLGTHKFWSPILSCIYLLLMEGAGVVSSALSLPISTVNCRTSAHPPISG